MEQKYAVPALERTHILLATLKDEPYKLKLSDLSKRLSISKSTLYYMLLTLERLQWVSRDRNETYAIGSALGEFGNAYFKQYDLVGEFQRLGEAVMTKLQESVQLAKLDGSDVLYLAKIAAPSPVQMVSGPGARFPAHTTGLGKALLAFEAEDELRRLYPEDRLEPRTAFTIDSRTKLFDALRQIRTDGVAFDEQEGVMGFCCVAAPVFGRDGAVAAAVSCSMPMHHWEIKKATAAEEIRALAKRLSEN